MILFDSRWIDNHGIGRFAKEISNRLEMKSYTNSYKPMSGLDSLLLSVDKKLEQYDLFFSPGYNAPLYSKKPFILTIHDLNHIDRIENSSLLKNIYYKTVLTRLCRKSIAIFTVSEFSKSRICDFFNVPSEKIFVIGNGVSNNFFLNKKKIILNKPYIFCVSNRKGHKNEEKLLRAFSKSHASNNTILVFTGDKTLQMEKLLSSLHLTNKVLFTGKISDIILAQYYKGAIFSIFPSLYEGFGLPIIESFASGTPVITSNITAMPEIAGDCALLINPNNIDEISGSIDTLFKDEQLRYNLSLKGKERAKLYTWENVIYKIEDAFNTLNYSYLIKRK